MPQPAPPPAPVTAETTTTTTEYEELPGSASPYPSLTLGGLAMIAAGIVVRRKR
jgi:LPXTG-motif cell wall-anchored protein